MADPEARPVRESFDEGLPGEIEFAKALVNWDTATKAKEAPDRSFKVPVREDFFTDEEFNKAKEAYDGLVGAITKAVLGTKLEGVDIEIGEVIKKSFAAPGKSTTTPRPFSDIMKDASKARSIDELLRMEGI